MLTTSSLASTGGGPSERLERGGEAEPQDHVPAVDGGHVIIATEDYACNRDDVDLARDDVASLTRTVFRASHPVTSRGTHCRWPWGVITGTGD